MGMGSRLDGATRRIRGTRLAARLTHDRRARPADGARDRKPAPLWAGATLGRRRTAALIGAVTALLAGGAAPLSTVDWSVLERAHFHIERPAATLTAPSDLVQNGGFDEQDPRTGNPAAWRGQHLGVKIALDRRFRYSGRASLRVQGDPDASVKVSQRLPALKPDTRYRLRFCVKTEAIAPNQANRYYNWGACGANVSLACGKRMRVSFPDRASFVGTKRWVSQGFVFKTDQRIEGPCSIALGIYHAGGCAWFDDLVIEEMP